MVIIIVQFKRLHLPTPFLLMVDEPIFTCINYVIDRNPMQCTNTDYIFEYRAEHPTHVIDILSHSIWRAAGFYYNKTTNNFITSFSEKKLGGHSVTSISC